MQKENDTLLVAKLREGNKFAFEALYEKYSARLYNTIVLLVYDKSLAKDITQSSFMTIWEKRSNLDTEKSFPAYLCTIARNMVYKETERRLLHNKFVENKLKTEAEAIEEDTGWTRLPAAHSIYSYLRRTRSWRVLSGQVPDSSCLLPPV